MIGLLKNDKISATIVQKCLNGFPINLENGFFSKQDRVQSTSLLQKSVLLS